MIWDKHDAAWRSHLAAAADHHRTHGHLAAPPPPRSERGSPNNGTWMQPVSSPPSAPTL